MSADNVKGAYYFLKAQIACVDRVRTAEGARRVRCRVVRRYGFRFDFDFLPATSKFRDRTITGIALL